MYNVYKIVNSINKKVYVGRTIHSIESRWAGHMQSLNSGDKRKLYCAMRKYGVDKFHIELIEKCKSFDDMVYKEAYYCELFDSYQHGYNMTTAGEINPMECYESKKSHDDKMRTPEVRNKISQSMKAVRANSRDYIYINKDLKQKRINPDLLPKYIGEGWKIGTIKGKIRLHDKSGRETTVFESEVDKYIAAGWLLGGKPGRLSLEHKEKLRLSHKKHTDEFKKEQSIRLKDYYKNNPNWKTRSKHAVSIENPKTGEVINFESCLELCRKTDIPESVARSGKVKSWINIGYIRRKSSMYNNWKIFKNEGVM